MSFGEENAVSLNFARQVLKEVSEWHDHLLIDIANKQRNKRTEELYSVVDAIGQDEEKVELARVRQLVHEHIAATEVDVKEKVAEQLKDLAKALPPARNGSNKPPKVTPRLPRVALLPPKGKQLKDKANVSEKSESKGAFTRNIPQKRPPLKTRPKTLSELMERNVKPLPESIFEEFGFSNNKINTVRRTTPLKNMQPVKKSIYPAISLAPPARRRLNAAPPKTTSVVLERSNVVMFNLGSNESDARKLTIQAMPSIHIESHARVSYPGENVKLINILDSEKSENIEERSGTLNHVPGAQLRNPLSQSKVNRVQREDSASDEKGEIGTFGRNDSKKTQKRPFVQEKTLVTGSAIDSRFVKSQTDGTPRYDDRSSGTTSFQLVGLTGKEPVHIDRPPSRDSPSSKLYPSASAQILRNVTNSSWTEQELIAKIVQEISSNGMVLGPELRMQSIDVFPDEELIRQLVLEVVREDFLRNCPPSSLLLNANNATGNAQAENNGLLKNNNSIKPANEADNIRQHLTLNKNDAAEENSFPKAIASVGTGEKRYSDNVPKNCDIVEKKENYDEELEKRLEIKKYRDAEVNTTGGNDSKNLIPKEIAVHVFIEDKRQSEKKNYDFNLKKLARVVPTEVPSVRPVVQYSAETTETRPQEESVKLKETVDAATESDFGHLEVPLVFVKEVRDVAVNVRLNERKEAISVGTQMDLMESFSPESADGREIFPLSIVKSPVSSSGDEEILQQKSFRDAAVQLSSRSSSSQTGSTTLTTTMSSEEAISDGELLFKPFAGFPKQQNASLDSTLQSIDEGEVTRNFSDGEIPVVVPQYSLQRVLSVGEVQQADGSISNLMEPKTKAGRRDDRSRSNLVSSLSEGETGQTSSSDDSPSPGILASPEFGVS